MAFVGWKTAAWHDRGAPRDLNDLWALKQIGALTDDAAALFAQHVTTGGPPQPFMFTTAPDEANWSAALSGQTRLEISAVDALRAVRHGWSRALGQEWDKH